MMPRTDKAKVQGLQTHLEQADRLMKLQNFAEAITFYDEHLLIAPTDLAAHMKLGLCYLLNRADNNFLRVFHAVRKQIEVAPDQPQEVHTLWDKYQALVVKVTAGALVIGGLSMAGCVSQGNASDSVAHPAPMVVESSADMPEITPPLQDREDFPFTAHKYSGGIYFNPEYYPPIIDLPPLNEEMPSTDKDQDEGGNSMLGDTQK